MTDAVEEARSVQSRAAALACVTAVASEAHARAVGKRAVEAEASAAANTCLRSRAGEAGAVFGTASTESPFVAGHTVARGPARCTSFVAVAGIARAVAVVTLAVTSARNVVAVNRA